MCSEVQKPHIFFFPLMAYGHMIPLVDIAELFASRKFKTTIITTPLNEPLVSRQIQRPKILGLDINIQLLGFPRVEVGLPEECENVDFLSSNQVGRDIIDKFYRATIPWRSSSETSVQIALLLRCCFLGLPILLPNLAFPGLVFIDIVTLLYALQYLIEEAKEMRKRAQTLGHTARRSVEEGGSSYSDLNAFIDELNLNSK